MTTPVAMPTKVLPMSRTECAIAELGEMLHGLATPAQVARKSPNLASLMQQRRELIAQARREVTDGADA